MVVVVVVVVMERNGDVLEKVWFGSVSKWLMVRSTTGTLYASPCLILCTTHSPLITKQAVMLCSKESIFVLLDYPVVVRRV